EAKTADACALVRKCSAGRRPLTKNPPGPYNASDMASRQRLLVTVSPCLRHGERFHSFLFQVHCGRYWQVTGTTSQGLDHAMSAPQRARPASCRAATPSADFPRSLTVGVIGAGRVGAVLGAALARAGHQIL